MPRRKKDTIDYVESLNMIPQVIEWSEKQDVERFSRFLVQQPNIPLYCFASGGASPTLHFTALLYETNRGMAKALTGLAISSISDETLKTSKILIFSMSGNGVDTKNVIDRAIAINPNGVGGLSGFNDAGDNYLMKKLKPVSNNWFQYNIPHIKDTFIGSISNIASMCLVYKAFTGDSDILDKLKVNVTPSSCFAYRTKAGEELDIQRLSAKNHYIALYGGWGEPASRDFENKMVESGIASVQLCDIRNFCHGRFIFMSNHFEDSVFVLFLTPREKEYADKLIFKGKDFYGKADLFPQATEIITIETDWDSPLATIELSIKSAVLVGQIGKTMGVDPFNPPNPYAIDKRTPRTLDYTEIMRQPLMNAVIQGKDGGLRSVSRKKVIVYDPKKTIQEIADANGVSVPTIRKYIIEKNIDRMRDEKMLLYNTIWKEYIKDSTITKIALADKLNMSVSTIIDYLGKEAEDIKVGEGKIGTVAEDTIVKELRNEVKDLQIRFEKFSKIREKYPNLSAKEFLKKLALSDDKKGKNLANVVNFMQMDEFKYIFKDKKIEFKQEKAIKECQETPLPTPIETIKKVAKVKEIKVTEKLDKFLKRNNIGVHKLLKLRDDILAKEAVRTKEYSKSWKPITWDDFGFRKTHIYDTKQIECWSFNSGKDVRDGITLQLGNMVNGFGVSLLGIDFINSEVPYQLAIFKNDEESVKIQKEIANPSNPLFRNGLKMKRVYIYSKEYAKYRRDNDFELGNGIWCYEWMKFITWEKVKQNKGFRDILLSIPKGAIIIEQAQKKSHTQWGAWNEALMKERKIVKAAFMSESGKGKTSNIVRDSIYLVNNNSKWKGENAEGQILTMAKLALNEGINMPIDVDILNEANICWFGNILRFIKDKDGSVRVEAVKT